MKLSDDQQLDILISRLRKHKYDIDETEKNHLRALIRRGVVKIQESTKTLESLQKEIDKYGDDLDDVDNDLE